MNRRQFFAASAAAGAVSALGQQAVAAETGQSGTFEGRSNHVTTGSVQIVEIEGKYVVELGDDFSLDGGPDPRVGLGADGTYDPESALGALLRLKGKQYYAVPKTKGISQYNEVYIWCEVAGVPLGVAKLN
ncbi:DM13 domain-containing protein [Thalassobius sp. Cn5-15]|jgi:hypothetical protein|uniref:DM13 domain-containing protein n=1 Tax=Thalassobius sp. Cn5-15 TaxID=2917763 RepID=UPI001EF2BE06|nr:DM13 domain-containing protein [Thalassobius sp. Cn5-15]MCG7493926.1 DM13 domain-containing protein [Thalassobius sp. Cn5-15]